MLVRLEQRPEASKSMIYVSPLIAVVLTVLTAMVMFALLGVDPVKAIETFFIEPVSSLDGLAELLVKATPLVLIGVGLSLGFQANVWNIGAEGQLVIGALAGGGLALAFFDQQSIFLVPAMLVCGVLGGMAWAAIPAWLKTRYNTNEILTSLMLTYVGLLVLSYLVHGPWKDPQGMNFPESRLFHDSALLPILIDETRLNVGALIALFVV
ncbi:MAG: ABC transporter permease, partial [Rhodospirillaceae bacterium]|nr:ABC transporter permease [Rhodospirillaceae bacterium]